MKKDTQMWLPGFEPKPVQPWLPGLEDSDGE